MRCQWELEGQRNHQTITLRGLGSTTMLVQTKCRFTFLSHPEDRPIGLTQCPLVVSLGIRVRLFSLLTTNSCPCKFPQATLLQLAHSRPLTSLVSMLPPHMIKAPTYLRWAGILCGISSVFCPPSERLSAPHVMNIQSMPRRGWHPHRLNLSDQAILRQRSLASIPMEPHWEIIM